MSFEWDGPGPCVNCGSFNLTENKVGEVCDSCGTNQKVWYKINMIENLLEYGFKKVEIFENKNLFQKIFNLKTKQLESYYKYGTITATYIENSSNMNINIGDYNCNLNQYGDFKYAKKKLDEIIEPHLRRLKLERLNEL